MRKTIIFFITSFFAFIITACTLETSGNGDFDGAWHLLRVNDEDSSSKNIYWNIQGKLIEAVDKNNINIRYLLRFKRENGQLKLSDPYIYDRENGDKPLTDSTLLKAVHIENIDEPFDIITLNGSRMTLSATNNKLEFRKF